MFAIGHHINTDEDNNMIMRESGVYGNNLMMNSQLMPESSIKKINSNKIINHELSNRNS